MALLAAVYDYESPVSMKQSGQHDNLRKLMEKMYAPQEVKQRTDQIAGAQENNGDATE